VRSKSKLSKQESVHKTIQHKSSDATFLAELIGNFSLADFVELLRAADPLPSNFSTIATLQDASSLPAEIGAQLGNLANEVAGLIKKVIEQQESERDHAINDVLQRLQASRFRPLVESLLKQDAENGPALKLYRATLIDFLLMTEVLINNLADGRAVPLVSIHATTIGFLVKDARISKIEDNRENPVPALINHFCEALDGADAKLLRRCANERCQRVFYARRKDARCCSRRCTNNLLQRMFYRKEQERKRQELEGKREKLKSIR
jgi:hypothetical protein